jgi:hypothetical protein
MLFYGFPNQRAPLAVLRIPTKAPLAPCGLGRSQSMSQRMTQRMKPIPTQLSETQKL